MSYSIRDEYTRREERKEKRKRNEYFRKML